MLQFSRIVNENISNVDMDVNFIAKQMGMSRASLYNKTKGMMDIGISEYIIKCRLEYARKLLDATTLSISEVAEQSGFKHSRNFSTVFKNAMGMSPSDYRKKIPDLLENRKTGILHAMLNLGQIRLSILVNVTNRVIILNLET